MSGVITCPVCDREGVPVILAFGRPRVGLQVAPHGHVTDPDPCPGSGVPVLSGSLSHVLDELARDAFDGLRPASRSSHSYTDALDAIRELFGALAIGAAVGDGEVPGLVWTDTRDLAEDFGYLWGTVTS